MSPIAREEYGQFRVAITPLMHQLSLTGFTADDYAWAEQFTDVSYNHPLNDGRTGSVALSMHDPLVAGLRPYEQALLLMYVRPDVDPEQGERVLWGQCNVVEDYDAGTVVLEAQDPSIRLQHHYLRVGDVALNNPHFEGKGRITIDDRGIYKLVQAGYFQVTPPIVGLAYHGHMQNTEVDQEVERGQEVWSTIVDLAGATGGPDFDIKPNHHADGALPAGSSSGEGRAYAIIHAYNPSYSHADVGQELQRDLTSVVVFQYGQPGDNTASLTITPQRPTNDAIVIDNAQSLRSRAQYHTGIEATGDWQDWLSIDQKGGYGYWDIFEQYAIAQLNANAVPLAQAELELHPDVGQDFFYGDPTLSFFTGTVGDFYLGDIVKVQAARGYRAVDQDYRITNVALSQSGAHGPVTTALTLVPNVTASRDEDVSTQPTFGTQSR